MTPINWEIDRILDGLLTCDGVYKKDLVDAAIELRAEITPHLIRILERVIDKPDEYIEDDNLFDHIYALMLLGHFRSAEAHRIIIDLFSLPGETSHELFGDIGLDNLPGILARTCGDTVEHIRSMALNRMVDDYFRVSAFHALAYAVLEGKVSREEVLELIAAQFREDEADETSDYWGLVACIALDLYPEEIMDTIGRAFETGMISPGMVDYKSFEKAIAEGKAKCLDRLKKAYVMDTPDDLHAAMSWWACFNPERKQRLAAPDIGFSGPGSSWVPEKAQRKRKADKKKKRKMARKSKRKNRR